MKNAKTASLVLCGAFMTLVGSFAWAILTTYESKDLNWSWSCSGDQANGGTSTVAITEDQENKTWTIKGNLGTGWEYCAAFITATPDAATLGKLKTSTGIAFKVLGDGDRYKIKMITSDVKDGGYFEYYFETVKGAAITVVVPTGYFLKPSWTRSGPGRLSMKMVTEVGFETGRPGTPGPFEIKIWDIRLFTGDTPALTAAEKKANDKAIADAVAAEAKIAKPVGGNLGAQSVMLTDNFQYGGNYQGHFRESVLFNGNRISKGETYTLQITYTADRDLEQSVWVGLVDPSPAASGWKPLSWTASRDLCEAGQEIRASKKGEVVSATLTFTTLNESTGINANANSLVFATRGEGKMGVKDSGRKGPVTLKFTEFVFTKN